MVQALPQGRDGGGRPMTATRTHAVAPLLAPLLAALALFACAGKPEITAPPPPLRPEAEPTPPKPQVTTQKDCEPANPDHESKPLGFDERSIPEGTRLAEQGKAKLRTASSAEVTKLT